MTRHLLRPPRHAPLVGTAKDQLLAGSERAVGHHSGNGAVSRVGRRQLRQRRRLGHARQLGKTSLQWAVTTGRTGVLGGTLTLGLIRQDHLANRFTTADGRIDEAHDVLLLADFSIAKRRKISLM